MSVIRKCKITIDKAKNPSTLTNHTVYLNEDNFPSEMFDADGLYPANADGGDIRIFADEFCTIPMARDVVEFTRDNDPANGTIELHTKFASLPTSTDPELWATYNDTTASEPAEDSTYGSENAYHTDKKAVWHLQESGDGTANEYNDATTNDNDGQGGAGDSGKTPAQAAFQISNGQDFDGTDNYIDCGTDNSLDITTEDFTLQFIVNMDTAETAPGGGTDGLPHFMSNSGGGVSGWEIASSTGSAGSLWLGTNEPSQVITVADGVFSAGVTYLVHATKEGSGAANVTFYVDGAEVASYSTRATHGDTITTNAPVLLGRYGGSATFYHLNGKMDEPRITVGRAFSADEATTEYNNLMDPANFASAGAPGFLYSGNSFAILID